MAGRTVADELDELERWANALAIVSRDHKAEILDTLSGKTELLASAPSAVAQARLVFGQMEKKFREVEAAMERCRAAIDKEA